MELLIRGKLRKFSWKIQSAMIVLLDIVYIFMFLFVLNIFTSKPEFFVILFGSIYFLFMLAIVFGVNSAYLFAKLKIIKVKDNKITIELPFYLNKVFKPKVIRIEDITRLDFQLVSPERREIKTLNTKNGMLFEINNKHTSKSYFEYFLIYQSEEDVNSPEAISVDVNYIDKKQFGKFILGFCQEYPDILISQSLENFVSYCENL